MSEEDPELRKQLAFYKQRVDELAGENLRNDYQISGLKKEIRQRRASFTLITELQQAIGAVKEVSGIFEKALPSINTTLGMDKTVVLIPTNVEDHFRPAHWSGYGEEAQDPAFAEQLRGADFEIPKAYTEGGEPLLVNKNTESTPLKGLPEITGDAGLRGQAAPEPEPQGGRTRPTEGGTAVSGKQLIESLRDRLSLPLFVAVPVNVEGKTIGLILSGRMKEAGTLFPPLDQGDIETFQAVAGLVSAVVRNMRVAVLQEMDRLKTDFFANMSHEFRTPITLTIGPLEGVLSGRYGEVSEGIASQARVMLRNQERLLGLVNQILELTKLEAGRMDLKAAPMREMNGFVQSRAAQFRPLAEKRNLELRLSLAPEVDQASLFIDREKLDKVLFNLLSNSFKFTNKGHVAVSTEVRDGQFLLTVSDSGVGIKADELPHVFDRFRQADGSASRDYAGTGIGLALVKEYVELHGGTVTVRSEYGKGTVFQVSVPLGSAHLDARSIVDFSDEESAGLPRAARVVEIREGAADQETEERANAEAKQHLDPARPTVLYVDDNRDLRHYVRDLLVQRYNVFLAVNGRDGLARARAHKPDLILSDLMMPVMTGRELCQKVREDPALQAIPFVLLTAKSSLDSKIEGLEEGADDYLSKPFSESELLARIKNLVSLRQQQVQLKRELSAAREIQRSLLPKAAPLVADLDVSALYRPCEELSGDFYDCVVHGQWLYVYVADVSSHGTASAQVTYLLRETFRELLRSEAAPELPQLVQALSARYASYQLEYDVALQVARIDARSFAVEFVRCAAPPAVLVTPGGLTVLTARPSPRLTRSFQPSSAPLEPPFRAALGEGSALYLFTDGCYELDAGGKPFGDRRLRAALQSLPTAGWAETLLGELVKAHGGERFEDDLTVLRLARPAKG